MIQTLPHSMVVIASGGLEALIDIVGGLNMDLPIRAQRTEEEAQLIRELLMNAQQQSGAEALVIVIS